MPGRYAQVARWPPMRLHRLTFTPGDRADGGSGKGQGLRWTDGISLRGDTVTLATVPSSAKAMCP